MGGVIGVDSSVGIGSVFWVELGLTAAPHRAVLEDPDDALQQPRCRTARRCAPCSTSRTIRPTWNWSSRSLRAAPTCACFRRQTASSASSSRAPISRR
jgi:hypothetical protein